MSDGNRVFLKRKTPSKTIVEGFKSIPTANIIDAMKSVHSLNSEIRLLSKPLIENMIGVALTVKLQPKDNLMIHQALEMSQEGDVLIITNGGDKSCALIGEIMSCYAYYTKKISGMVLDGYVRDINEISKMEFPIYATGYTPGGPSSKAPGEINVPILIGGVVVNPGDIIVGDLDGVIVIPQGDAEKVLDEARLMLAKDYAKVEASKNGSADKKWIALKLEELNCEMIN